MLQTIGLDDTCVQIYRLLLKSGGGSTESIGLLADLPGPEVESAISTLAASGIVWTDHRDGLVRPARPEYGLAALASKREAEILSGLHEVRLALVQIEQLAAEYRQARSDRQSPILEVIADLWDVPRRVHQLVGEYGGPIEAFVMNDQAGLAEELADYCAGEDGREVRCVVTDGMARHPEHRKLVERLAENGAQVRTTALLPAWKLLVGRRVALVPDGGGFGPGGATVIGIESVAASLGGFFDLVWLHADPVGPAEHAAPQAKTGVERGPSTTEKSVLRMLADGLTDAAIARKLDVSTRTVRRMIVRLQQTLEARSRFELAVLAAKRDWI